jgi:hypothetical protein
VEEPKVLDAKALQCDPWGFSRHVAYELVRRYGVRVSARRWVIGRERLEDLLNGRAP